MSVYIHCRLKPISLPEETQRRYIIPTRFSSQQAAVNLFEKKQTNELSVSLKKGEKLHPPKNYKPYSQEELTKNYKGFCTTKKLNIEICCGSGDFLVNAAKMQPEEMFVGVDVALPCVQRAVKKAQEAQLRNIWFYCGSGDDFFSFDFQNILASRIMVNFPDPWPKKRHVKRRVISALFVHNAVKSLATSGQIITVTDVPPLAREHFALLEGASGLRSLFMPPPAFVAGEAEGKFSSKFYSVFSGVADKNAAKNFKQGLMQGLMQKPQKPQKMQNNANNSFPQIVAQLEKVDFLPVNFYKFTSAYQQKNLAKSCGFYLTAHQKI